MTKGLIYQIISYQGNFQVGSHTNVSRPCYFPRLVTQLLICSPSPLRPTALLGIWAWYCASDPFLQLLLSIGTLPIFTWIWYRTRLCSASHPLSTIFIFRRPGPSSKLCVQDVTTFFGFSGSANLVWFQLGLWCLRSVPLFISGILGQFFRLAFKCYSFYI